MITWLLLLAEGEAGGAGGGAAPSPLGMLPVLVAIGLLFYLMILKPDQKRAASVRTMRENVKKNDRVVTAGGIYGTVTNVQRDANEVTIKVDEATNTKLRITLESIARVISDETPEDAGKSGS